MSHAFWPLEAWLMYRWRTEQLWRWVLTLTQWVPTASKFNCALAGVSLLRNLWMTWLPLRSWISSATRLRRELTMVWLWPGLEMNQIIFCKARVPCWFKAIRTRLWEVFLIKIVCSVWGFLGVGLWPECQRQVLGKAKAKAEYSSAGHMISHVLTNRFGTSRGSDD